MLNVLISSKRAELSSLLFTKIKEDLDAGRQVVLVVPAQSTMSIEKEAFSILGKTGFFNLHIIRGQKLAETILGQTKRPSSPVIDRLGREMLLRSIAGREKDQLAAFPSESESSEFLTMVSDFIVQLKQNGLGMAELDEISAKTKSPLLKDKLSDMKLFFGKYEEAMAGKFTDSEDLVLFTAEQAKNSAFVKESVIYYYGFYAFTNRELVLLGELAKYSLGLNVALLCDGEDESNGEDVKASKADYFAVTRTTLKKLKALMDVKLPVSPSVQVPGTGEGLSPEAPEAPETEVHVVACASPYSQALTIAADIKKKVREQDYSYSDFAVLTGNSEEMSSSIKRVFKEAGIPIFADEKRNVLHSGAIEAVSSSLNLAVNNFKPTDAIRFLKSGVLDFEQEDIEYFENYVKLYHIKGSKFASAFKYGREELGDEIFDRIENMREIFYSVTSKFTGAFEKAATVLDKAKVLYSYLSEDLHLAEKLDSLSQSQDEAGLVDAAEESRQVFGLVINLLDQMVDLLGTEEMSSKDFAKLLTDSLASIEVGVLPQAEGKVSIGTISRSQLESVKALYIAGINDDIIPSKNDPTSILTPKEMADIEGFGFTIAKNSKRLSDEEMFSIYKSLSAATDYLFLSYCTGDNLGKELKPSTLIADIKKLHPGLITESDILSTDNSLNFIEGKTLTLNKLSSELRRGMEEGSLDPIWMQSYNLLKDDATEIKEGLRYTNKKSPLGKEIAKKLFEKNDNFSLSPSRLDNFASCPFKHFVSYGLKPKEEKEFAMNASEIGTIHHEALLKLCDELSLPAKKGGFSITDEKSLWMTVTDDELKAMLEKILSELKDDFLGGVMSSSKESAYTSKRTKDTCLKFARHMVEEVRHSVIDEMYFESRFARDGIFPAIVIETTAGKVYVEGRIDRVDVCPNSDAKYVRVIDYKSGNTKFNKDLVSAGLQLQLMTYLESALEKYPNSSTGGVYYFHIKDASAAANLEDFPKDEIAEDVLKKIQKEYSLDGMDIDEEFKKNFAEKLESLCGRLTSGNIDVEPKKFKTLYNSCQYCEYNSICQKEIK